MAIDTLTLSPQTGLLHVAVWDGEKSRVLARALCASDSICFWYKASTNAPINEDQIEKIA
jgi:hypothetical protein